MAHITTSPSVQDISVMSVNSFRATYLAKPTPQLHVFNANATLSEALGILVRRLSKESAPNPFIVALSGGSLPNLLWAGLAPLKDQIDWKRWHVIFADERCVPHQSPDSNFAACASLLANIPSSQIYPISETLIQDPLAAAEAYDQVVHDVLQGQSISLTLLGMGPDGHTCSLFPNHTIQMNSTTPYGLVAAVNHSPKPPSTRITLTLKAVCASRAVVYVCTGEGKRQALKGVLEQEERSNFPAGFARPYATSAEYHWLVDEPATLDLDPNLKSKLMATKI
jgi:6-phosphogluconolactonase